MNDDSRDTGIPTRAIHEGYLGMQQAHRQFRQAKDDPSVDERPAHADFQDAVLTFYELTRPHLKRKSAMGEFWHGELPDYPDRPWGSVEHAKQDILTRGTAVWNLQRHVQSTQVGGSAGDQTALADGGATLSDFHERLNLAEKQRIVALEQEGDVLTWIELRAVAGLKQLDSWDTREMRSREQQDGFMSGETSVVTDLQHVPVWKLTTAKRLLAEAADKMSLLSSIDIDHEDGAIVNFDMSRDDIDPEYRDAEYNSSPDI